MSKQSRLYNAQAASNADTKHMPKSLIVYEGIRALLADGKPRTASQIKKELSAAIPRAWFDVMVKYSRVRRIDHGGKVFYAANKNAPAEAATSNQREGN